MLTGPIDPNRSERMLEISSTINEFAVHQRRKRVLVNPNDLYSDYGSTRKTIALCAVGERMESFDQQQLNGAELLGQTVYLNFTIWRKDVFKITVSPGHRLFAASSLFRFDFSWLKIKTNVFTTYTNRTIQQEKQIARSVYVIAYVCVRRNSTAMLKQSN